MNRRNFMRSLVGGVAAAAAVRTFPFRVFSFPTEIVVPPLQVHISEIGVLNAETLKVIDSEMLFDNFFLETTWLKKLRERTDMCLHPGGMRLPLTWSAE